MNLIVMSLSNFKEFKMSNKIRPAKNNTWDWLNVRLKNEFTISRLLNNRRLAYTHMSNLPYFQNLLLANKNLHDGLLTGILPNLLSEQVKVYVDDYFAEKSIFGTTIKVQQVFVISTDETLLTLITSTIYDVCSMQVTRLSIKMTECDEKLASWGRFSFDTNQSLSYSTLDLVNLGDKVGKVILETVKLNKTLGLDETTKRNRLSGIASLSGKVFTNVPIYEIPAIYSDMIGKRELAL